MNATRAQQTSSLAGLRFHAMPGDGDCLFHAIVYHLGENVMHWRRRVADYMDSNPGDFLSFHDGDVRDFMQRLEAIRNDRAWGDEPEVAALQRLTKRPIVVVMTNKATSIYGALAKRSGPPIFLYYNGDNHYDTYDVEEGYDSTAIFHSIQQRSDEARFNRAEAQHGRPSKASAAEHASISAPKSIKNSAPYPELGALQSEFIRVHGSHLEDVPNKDNTLFIFVQQGFENVAVMMDYILGLGIKKEYVFMTTKPQTTSQEMRERFRNQADHYIDFQWNAPVDHKKSHYSQKIAATNQALLDEVTGFLAHHHGQDIENILVLDEGGRFLSLAAEELKKWRDVSPEARRIIAVEHTMSGTRNFNCSTLDFPYILMADCYLKTQVEAHYVAEGVVEASREILAYTVEEQTVFGVIGCGNVGRHVVELIRAAYPDKAMLVSDRQASVLTATEIRAIGWDNVERKENNVEVFEEASIIFGCTGQDITAGLTPASIAGLVPYTTLISASSGDREYLSLLIHSPDYRLESSEDISDISFQVDEDCQKRITIKNGGFPINFRPDRQYGIPLDKVGITLAMKYAAVMQALELFSLFQLAQLHPDSQKRAWLTRYMMLNPRLQQMILENFSLVEDQPLSNIINDSKGDEPMTKAKITGEVLLTDLLVNFYQGRGTIPLLFDEEVLPMDQAFTRLRVNAQHLKSQENEDGYWPLELLFLSSDHHRPIQHIVIEGQPGMGKTTLSQFIGFACFNHDIYEQVAHHVESEAQELNQEGSVMLASPLLREVHKWANLFKGVLTLRMRDLNNFTAAILQVNRDGTDPYSLAQYQMAEFILSQHNLGQQASMGATLKQRAEKLLSWLYSADANQKSRDHYLLILDGYDELTGGMYQDAAVVGHGILTALLGYPFWMITSRPNQVDAGLLRGDHCDRHLMLEGFDNADAEAYIRAIVPILNRKVAAGVVVTSAEEKVDSLLIFLANHPGLKQLVRVPICCQLLCYLWDEAQTRLESMKQLTPALLYKEMILLLTARARLRNAQINSSSITDNDLSHENLVSYYAETFTALIQLSFSKQVGDESQQLVVTQQDLGEHEIEGEVETIVTRELHLLNATQKVNVQRTGFSTHQPAEYEYTHLSFQEFLAANELVKRLASDNEVMRDEVIQFVAQNKYEQRYRNMLCYAASIVMEDDCNYLWGGDALQRECAKVSFWRAVREPVRNVREIETFEWTSGDSSSEKMYRQTSCKRVIKNETVELGEDGTEHKSLLVDILLHMGNKLDHLPPRSDGRGDYDGLEANIKAIVEKLFASRHIAFNEDRLLEVLNKVPGGCLGKYFTEINELCLEKFEEDINNISKCEKFMSVFIVNEKVITEIEEIIINKIKSRESRWGGRGGIFNLLASLGERGCTEKINNEMLDQFKSKSAEIRTSICQDISGFILNFRKINVAVWQTYIACFSDQDDNVKCAAMGVFRGLDYSELAQPALNDLIVAFKECFNRGADEVKSFAIGAIVQTPLRYRVDFRELVLDSLLNPDGVASKQLLYIARDLNYGNVIFGLQDKLLSKDHVLYLYPYWFVNIVLVLNLRASLPEFEELFRFTLEVIIKHESLDLSCLFDCLRYHSGVSAVNVSKRLFLNGPGFNKYFDDAATQNKILDYKQKRGVELFDDDDLESFTNNFNRVREIYIDCVSCDSEELKRVAVIGLDRITRGYDLLNFEIVDLLKYNRQNITVKILFWAVAMDYELFEHFKGVTGDKFWEKFLDCLNHNETNLRVAACKALAWLSDDCITSSPDLCNRFVSCFEVEDIRVREVACEVLAELSSLAGQAEIMPAFVRCFTSYSNSSLLDPLYYSTYLPTIDSESSVVRAAGCKVIAMLDELLIDDYPEMVRAFRGCFSDRLSEVRISACTALGGLGHHSLEQYWDDFRRCLWDNDIDVMHSAWNTLVNFLWVIYHDEYRGFQHKIHGVLRESFLHANEAVRAIACEAFQHYPFNRFHIYHGYFIESCLNSLNVTGHRYLYSNNFSFPNHTIGKFLNCLLDENQVVRSSAWMSVLSADQRIPVKVLSCCADNLSMNEKIWLARLIVQKLTFPKWKVLYKKDILSEFFSFLMDTSTTLRKAIWHELKSDCDKTCHWHSNLTSDSRDFLVGVLLAGLNDHDNTVKQLACFVSGKLSKYIYDLSDVVQALRKNTISSNDTTRREAVSALEEIAPTVDQSQDAPSLSSDRNTMYQPLEVKASEKDGEYYSALDVSPK